MAAQQETVVNTDEETLYLSPRSLARRWDCSRSSVQRIAEEAGIPKVFLGRGRNGMVRYPLKEIEEHEASRTVGST